MLACLFVCSFVIFEGKIYDPADIEIVNRFNGVDRNDITDEVIDEVMKLFGDGSLALEFLLDIFGGLP